MVEILKTIVTIVYVIISFGLVIVVLMQEGKSGLSSAISGTSDTYWGKNKDNSLEGILPRLTKVFAVLFIILSVVLNMI